METTAKYLAKCSMLGRSGKVKLKVLQNNFHAFISADYMMSKNLPYRGETAQPAKTYYYQMKLVCDVFGIVNHCDGKNYTLYM